MREESGTTKRDPENDLEARQGENSPEAKLTAEQLRRRREWLSTDWAMIALVLLAIYLAIGEVWTADKEGTSVWKAIWSFVKSYFGIALSAGILLVVLSSVWTGLREALKAWGGYLLALVLGPIALWYWAGSYNIGRDIVIVVVTTVVLLFARRFVTDSVARSVAAVAKWCANRAWRSANEKRLAIARVAESDGKAEEAARLRAPLENKSAHVYARTRAFFARRRARQTSLVLTWLIATWVLASFCDRAFGPRGAVFSEPLATDVTRFSGIANEAWSSRPPDRLGVALSGGGFRAALLHAGVLDALEERGIPIASLATVSGGSIIGAFYVAGGRPADFRDAVAEGRFNLKRELVDFPNLVRLLCPGHIPFADIHVLWWCSFSRVDVQANLLDRVLLGGKTLAKLREENRAENPWWKNPPWWVLGATDLRYGQGVGLTADGIFRRGHATPSRGLQTADTVEADLRRLPSEPSFEDMTKDETFAKKKVAELVAVSGAFPGAFGSTVLSIGKDTTLQVVDGGITDNLGYSLLTSALEHTPKRWPLDMVLISDGGMPLSQEKDVTAYSEFFRAMDVVYASSGIMVKPNRVKKIWLSPRTIVPDALTAEDHMRLPSSLRERIPTLREFQQDVEKAQRIFLNTSTLKDRFHESWIEKLDRRYWHADKLPGDGAAVGALYRLGQYLVYINLPDICRGLGRTKDNCERVNPGTPRLTTSRDREDRNPASVR